MTNPTALVTGGAGFIGSHCCLDLLMNGYEVVVVDNLVNSSATALDRVRRISGRDLTFYDSNVADPAAMDAVFRNHKIDVVVHFAAYKAVGDSMNRPLEYYSNNLTGLLTLLTAMRKADVKHLNFSSSCSIYGDAAELPITEASPARPTNPYAQSKWMSEQILVDLCSRYPDWSVTALRYFNPAAPTRAERSAKSVAECPVTSCHTSARSPQDGWTRSRSSGRTTPPRTAPQYATTST